MSTATAPRERARFEAQIKHYDTTFGNEFEDALTAVAFHNGLSWFTDEQIAEIRDLMVKTEWKRRAGMNASRASYRAVADEAEQLLVTIQQKAGA
jgi:hypothetical protein